MPVSVTIRAANKIPVNILGAFEATFSGMSPKKEVISCDWIVYEIFNKPYKTYEIQEIIHVIVIVTIINKTA